MLSLSLLPMHLTFELGLLNAALLTSPVRVFTSLPQPPNRMTVQLHEKENSDSLLDQLTLQNQILLYSIFFGRVAHSTVTLRY